MEKIIVISTFFVVGIISMVLDVIDSIDRRKFYRSK